ncbi:MAG: recombination protein RecR [Candidatus Yanofskybacteria bacterium RIFCSPLOWO2_02_FULL_43_10]|uniref:Recombination protein RecR n=1 Tax=Candidatus Yanofskybacteria bacterium RIFCSPLOWO2_12_FULL_43_11b TaxID=1802710 RepID=A0A1F8H6L1_9BACT|nr:MAG: recombination protein RecR [Candidatus Yanofskybacteria bacterium RIFCSPHIGHO2_01_FULL_43_32]OGN11998.1 MAG: recombination protein RecR [Candidatus Yanofskybacteria bacterium RIFCSPHIGHO2_02_FULL_43_12]OGN24784.1 MAG: recombination protein RecR [Candidatus Yanofskybacteria bacterium RIFCSPLOWO2_01_FULL_43_46]OGN28959.1 MAG: recombination protein RecR [Candidatus Yanofskybacteria bacterium RIFCSPLOWO2_02_FULL_43_10]OGN33217.1 MAG: recombination protein RecR [Candidatus Yanofskybacteria b
MNTKFKDIVKLFQKLPGVGPRQAARFVIALMDKPEEELREFGKAVANLRKEISFCPVCFNISDNGLCSVCLDGKRDQAKLLVVEKVTDLDSIERTGLYKGLYHVLGGAINPLDGLTPETLRLKELAERIGKLGDKNIELIIATNPNTAGETTSHYIREVFGSASWRKKGVYLTRLARGLSSGSNLEYTDEITLKNALDYRK